MKEKMWLDVIDKALCDLAAVDPEHYTAEVECAHGVVQCILARQITVDWLEQPARVPAEKDEGGEHDNVTLE